jgi:hypothetical protein
LTALHNVVLEAAEAVFTDLVAALTQDQQQQGRLINHGRQQDLQRQDPDLTDLEQKLQGPLMHQTQKLITETIQVTEILTTLETLATEIPT